MWRDGPVVAPVFSEFPSWWVVVLVTIAICLIGALVQTPCENQSASRAGAENGARSRCRWIAIEAWFMAPEFVVSRGAIQTSYHDVPRTPRFNHRRTGFHRSRIGFYTPFLIAANEASTDGILPV